MSEVKIRRLNNTDFRDALEMCVELHAESSFAFLPLVLEKVLIMLKRAVNEPNSFLCLIAERDGEAVGLFYGVMMEYYFCEERMAKEYWVYVRKDHRGTQAGTSFIKKFYRWAADNGAKEVMVAPSTGIQTKRTEDWLNKLGYETCGVMTKRRV